jgi:hypothetical protein
MAAFAGWIRRVGARSDRAGRRYRSEHPARAASSGSARVASAAATAAPSPAESLKSSALRMGSSWTRLDRNPRCVEAADVRYWHKADMLLAPGDVHWSDGVRTAMRYLYMAQTERETLQLRRPMFPRRREDETSDD